MWMLSPVLTCVVFRNLYDHENVHEDFSPHKWGQSSMRISESFGSNKDARNVLLIFGLWLMVNVIHHRVLHDSFLLRQGPACFESVDGIRGVHVVRLRVQRVANHILSDNRDRCRSRVHKLSIACYESCKMFGNHTCCLHFRLVS